MLESYGFLSTYPPTQCGLATFTASLLSALHDGSDSVEVGVVRAVERADQMPSPDVVHQLVTSRPGGEAAAAEALERFGVAIIQHEYGIYGGPDGDSVIGILRRLRVPSIVVLHTVLDLPTPHQRRVLEQVAQLASVVVVMTETARRRLLAGYRVDEAKIALIAHGAPTDWGLDEPQIVENDSPSILTWGLLGPGKGIEWMVAALAMLRDLDPAPHYVVAGETHPQVLERDGESYRAALEAQAERLGVGHLLRFDNRYLDKSTLRNLVRAADVVVLPYDSTDQVTSGVLTEAITARRPVVATAFPHARELLSSGAGTIVPHRDPTALAIAVRRILTDPLVASSMGAAGGRLAPGLSWANVADRYREIGQMLRREEPSVVA